MCTPKGSAPRSSIKESCAHFWECPLFSVSALNVELSHELQSTTLQCSELRQTEEFHLPPIRQSHHHGNSSNHDSDAAGSPSTPKVLTLVDVLPEVAHREATSGAKPSAGWPLHQAPLPTAHASRALRRNGMPAV